MSRMDLDQNAALREQGWRVFRSSTRDRLIPQTGSGGRLQRIKIGSALPVLGVFEGVALSDEERAARSKARDAMAGQVQFESQDRPLGVSQYLSYDAITPAAAATSGDPNVAEILIAIAPFDGFITEAVIQPQGGAVPLSIAIRTSGGQTMFRGLNSSGLVAGAEVMPDYLSTLNMLFGAPGLFELRNLKMPVFAGEQILFLARFGAPFPLSAQVGSGVLGFEGFILAKQGSAAAVSMFGALTIEARRAATESAAHASRFSIEQERSRRAEIEAKARVDVAAIKAAPAPPSGGFIGNPYNNILRNPQFAPTLARQAPRPAPPPRVIPPKPEPPEGTGKTFVSAWMPSAASIGYLIPDPPRGGKVTVFDNKYTVWSVSGARVSEGRVETIASGQEIPPGARISR